MEIPFDPLLEYKTCEICRSPCVVSGGGQDEKGQEIQFKKENSSLLPGSEGCLNLNTHLRVYFIVTKLLKIPQQEFVKLITPNRTLPKLSTSFSKRRRCSSPLKGNQKNGKSGEEQDLENDGKTCRLLYSTTCDRCDSIVNEAIGLHRNMMELQSKIDKLGETLFEVKEISDKEEKEEIERTNLSQGLHRRSCSNDEKGEDSTSKKMLGLSLACLGKVPFPKDHRKSKKEISPRKRRQRNLILEASSSKHTPPRIGENETSLQSQMLTTEDVHIKIEEEDPLNEVEDHAGCDNSCNDDYVEGDKHGAFLKSTQRGNKFEKQHECYTELTEQIDDNMEFSPKNYDDDSDYEPDGKSDEVEELEDDDNDSDLDFGVPLTKKTKKDSTKPTVNSSRKSNDNETIKIVDNDGNVITGGVGVNPVAVDQFQSKSVVICSDNKLVEFQCKDCNRIFPRRTTYRYHMKTAHGQEINYICPKCPELQFRTKRELVQHRTEVHENVCDKCGKRLARRNSLIQHYQLVHKMKFTFTCPLCKKTFKKKGDLRSHRAKAHRASPDILAKMSTRPPQNEEEEEWAKIPCQECGKRFLSGHTLDYHVANQHIRGGRGKNRKRPPTLTARKKMSCYFCWKKFTLDQRRSIHIKMSHPEKIVRLLEIKFPCEKCNNDEITFPSCELLREHYEKEHGDSSNYVCDMCWYPFFDQDSLNKHIYHHKRHDFEGKMKRDEMRKTYEFKCWFCWEAFPVREGLQKHLKTSKRHLKLNVEFPCDVEHCEHNIGKPFKSVNELNEHLSSCHGDIGEIYHCTVCNWGFISNDMLTIHKLNHVPRIKSHYKCPECDHMSGQLTALKNHYNITHDLIVKLHKCPHCKIGFPTQKAVHCHIAFDHKNIKQDPSTIFQCDQCAKNFPTEISLKSHMNRDHVEHICAECGQVFHNQYALWRHKKSKHTTAEPCLCSVCGKAFPDKTGLKCHMRIHGEAKYECHICHHKMKDPGNLRQHIQRNHEKPKKVGPPPKFPCTQCDRGFMRKDTLDDHIRVEHSLETHRVWTCEQCGKRFNRIGCLQTHIKGKGCRARLEALSLPTKMIE